MHFSGSQLRSKKLTVDDNKLESELLKEEEDEKVEEEEEEYFPRTIEGFGYCFNDEGRLVNTSSNAPFNFNVRKNNPGYNQLHYESLGEVSRPTSKCHLFICCLINPGKPLGRY